MAAAGHAAPYSTVQSPVPGLRWLEQPERLEFADVVVGCPYHAFRHAEEWRSGGATRKGSYYDGGKMSGL
ncbi:hypothetical protein NDU88_004154 [Pleurodeles waltl]|uniref:Uncharacterized protein n=1 Tax=Pleurodeles waltl TaxID=8319 RepID=A0AAV7T8Y1_PLEWA|nr:hypothetical protein NDU88_004154 [Pleurodeles waltl]